MLLGSEGGGVEPTDYPLAREGRHPGLCLVDRVLLSRTYRLKDKVSRIEEINHRAAYRVVEVVCIFAVFLGERRWWMTRSM
jgi:hypothetical protein